MHLLFLSSALKLPAAPEGRQWLPDDVWSLRLIGMIFSRLAFVIVIAGIPMTTISDGDFGFIFYEAAQ